MKNDHPKIYIIWRSRAEATWRRGIAEVFWAKKIVVF